MIYPKKTASLHTHTQELKFIMLDLDILWFVIFLLCGKYAEWEHDTVLQRKILHCESRFNIQSKNSKQNYAPTVLAENISK